MGKRILVISSPYFVDTFTEGLHDAYSVDRDAIPKDAKVVEVTLADRWREGGGEIRILLESESWPSTPDGQEYPMVSPWMTRRS